MQSYLTTFINPPEGFKLNFKTKKSEKKPNVVATTWSNANLSQSSKPEYYLNYALLIEEDFFFV